MCQRRSMDDSNEPESDGSASPDEMLAGAGLALGEAILASLPTWTQRVIDERCGRTNSVTAAEANDVGRRMAESLAGPLAALFAADVDRQRGTPLTLLRAAHGPLTELLAAHGTSMPVRDEVDIAAAPDDVFAISPRRFLDLGDDVHEAGLRWGVAKAFAHRARHLDRR